MPYSIQFLDKNDYLIFSLSGEIDNLDELISYAESVISQTRISSHKRLLLDETGVSMNVDTHDAILFAKHLAGAKVAHLGFRAAVICAPENYALIQSFETALQNRSMNYKVFKEIDAAEEWLKS